ncbi:MAG: hypothetical protein KC561_17140, partial [Myxococcales bacterium]|nr:hypothetical protein [Myxococcales bacterium]
AGSSGTMTSCSGGSWGWRAATCSPLPFFSDCLTIVDDPLIVRGLASTLFDGEGIACHPMTIVERGVVKNIYVDTYYGRKTGMAVTRGGASNRLVLPGERSLDEILGAVGSGVYVTSWLGGNADPTTGDFSFGMRGRLIEDGRLGQPVGEMNVTGNLRKLFNSLVELGNDPYPYSSLNVPTLVFEDVQFSGK